MQLLEMKERIVHPFARRFFAGVTLAEAVSRVRYVNSRGMSATLDFLGEDTGSVLEAEAALAEYLRVLDAIQTLRLDCSLAIKLTHIGLRVDADMAVEAVQMIGRAASEKGVVVWVDMEGSEHTGKTIDAYRRLRGVHPGAGIALQACLHRTPADLKSLENEGALIRLVKGAYREGPDVAITGMREIRGRYIELMATLFRDAGYFAVGTHDRAIIDAAKGLAQKSGHKMEFQMLMGMRDGMKAELVADGMRVVEYIPYGADWYGYGMRRLMEKKRNAVYFALGLAGR